MIHFFYIHPNATKYFFRRKETIIDYNMDLLRKYSGHDFRLYVDYDTCTLIDITDNRIIFHEAITRSMDSVCSMVADMRDLWQFLRKPETITTQYQYNRFVKLKSNYYG